MAEKKKRQTLGKPVQIRFPNKLQSTIQEIADQSGIEFVDAARLAIRFGVPVLRERMRDAIKAA